MNGILLAIQFFTAFPIKKELPLGRKEVTAMYVALPFVGAAIGLIMYAVSVFTLHTLGMSTLLVAVIIVVTGIILTGGLHLDGFADTADAFFSYKERNKRLEILEDPRLGAFGTMALVLLIVVKIALFNEILLREAGNIAFFLAIPLVARAAMNVYFTTLRLAKDKGIAHFFKEKLSEKWVGTLSLITIFVALLAIGLTLNTLFLPIVLFVVITVALLSFRYGSLKHFGGVTGDLSGAFIEGMEAVLWLTVILFI